MGSDALSIFGFGSQGSGLELSGVVQGLLGFGVPYFNTCFLKGTLMKYKFILFSPWLLKSPV